MGMAEKLAEKRHVEEELSQMREEFNIRMRELSQRELQLDRKVATDELEG